MNAKQELMLNQLYAAWTVCRRIGFWLRWAFLVLFVVPSVMACGALALASGFSFTSIPRMILQGEAEAARLPAAPDGMLTVQVCKDPAVTSVDGKPVPAMPPLVCKNFGYEQRSIEAMAQENGRYLWVVYGLAVLMACAIAHVFNVFDRSRRAFLASLETNNEERAKK
ncbi:hypothetical protein [Burkholderia cenocepacia]|uniref:hypothetical protein n=1 Tax=Burkholderia cenocepacia TaxID=95486 RepID=UPI002ABDC1C2|nr:hypothetical protein [Burkholderia cenocepacia]